MCWTPRGKRSASHLKFNWWHCLAFCSDSITHIVAENNSGSEVLEWLQVQNIKASSQLELLDVSWLIESMGAGKPVEMTGKHQLVSVMVVIFFAPRLMIRNMGCRINRPGLDPRFPAYSLCDLGQVTQLFWASVSSSTIEDSNSTTWQDGCENEWHNAKCSPHSLIYST